MSRVREGPSCGFDDFARTTGPRVHRTVVLMLGGRDGADDIVQEALLAAWRHWSRIDRDAAAYTYKTATRLAFRRLRAHAADEDAQRRLAAEAKSSGNVLAAEIFDQDLQGCLTSLPRMQRSTLILRFVADLSVDATAEILGIRPSTVKNHTRAGLMAMRRLLAPHSVVKSERRTLNVDG